MPYRFEKNLKKSFFKKIWLLALDCLHLISYIKKFKKKSERKNMNVFKKNILLSPYQMKIWKKTERKNSKKIRTKKWNLKKIKEKILKNLKKIWTKKIWKKKMNCFLKKNCWVLIKWNLKKIWKKKMNCLKKC